MRIGILVWLTWGLWLLPQSAPAQFGEDDDFPPGLLAKYKAGVQTFERIDPAVAFDWGTEAPDPRLPKGDFSAEWKGTLLVRVEGEYQLHAFLQGNVRIDFAGQAVLSGQAEKPAWVSGKKFQLKFGDQPITVKYRRTSESARVQLFWSSDSFDLEPIPALLMFRESGRPDLNLREAGRVLFAASRCNRCHQRETDPPAPSAPALTHLKDTTDWNWLVAKIKEPHAAPAARMPHFGFSKEQAEQIAAYLMQSSQAVELAEFKSKDTKADARKGQVLFRSVGCLACHTNGNEGQAGPFGGGDLSQVGEKRTAPWLNTWLKSPASLNPDHRMPLVKLSSEERRQLAVFLSSLGERMATSNSSINEQAVRIGERLVKLARCASCHRLGSEEQAKGESKLADLSQPIEDWSKSCLADQPNVAAFRPAFPQLKPEERKAIQSYLKFREGRIGELSDFDRGRITLEQKNCLSCHERNHSKGIVPIAGRMSQIDPDLEGQSEALIPPALNAVGDKLLDEALAEAVSGDQPKPRMPWLKIRMPKFRHTKEEKATLVHYFISQDRVPDGAPSVPAIPPKVAGDVLVAGHTLLGAKGLSCVACHRMGAFEPRNVALGTRGSDLVGLGKRMRKSYYLRWSQSPQRIVPGMEMPSIRKAVPGILGEDIQAQLAATWDALNDPRFTAPTAPSAVEQLLIAQPGEPARIVRDVFTNPQDNGGGYVARSFAIGLPNGHSVLFDLDNFTLRNWTFGDFARQRTEGKSWYWDLAGVPVMKGFTSESDFALQKTGTADGPRIMPAKEQNSAGRLVGYKPSGDGVELKYVLRFLVEGKTINLSIKESIRPTATGWSRQVRASDVPAGYDLLLAKNARSGLVGKPIVSVSDSQEIADSEFAPISGGLTISYATSGLVRPDLESPPKPEPTIEVEEITSLPGYIGKRLPLSGSIMPTALTWTVRDRPGIPKGTLAFTSLKGHVYLATDTDGDGLEDSLTTFEEGLAAPYGILPYGRGFLVAHKPELIYLEDTTGDNRADVRQVVATGWGYSDNYHDWTTSLIRDSKGRFYVGLGSDYAQPKRSKETSRWRGDVIQITPTDWPNESADIFDPWTITPIAKGFRYPTGLAINRDDDLFATDNQGVQNTFNEINHLIKGRHYGVPSQHETDKDAVPFPPAIQVPHPWTRSVNGVFFLPESGGSAFHGQGIGCEYDTRFLIRFSLQKIAGEYQGAAYYFSRPNAGVGGDNFQGPLCGGISPTGEIYIGSIHDSGWLGGQNTGDIVRLSPTRNRPINGIREVRATPTGFDVEFLEPIDAKAALDVKNYQISGYTRKWQGSYATPDSGRHNLEVESVKLDGNGRVASLVIKNLREGYVYEIRCGGLAGQKDKELFPDAAHYTLHRIPSD